MNTQRSRRIGRRRVSAKRKNQNIEKEIDVESSDKPQEQISESEEIKVKFITQPKKIAEHRRVGRRKRGSKNINSQEDNNKIIEENNKIIEEDNNRIIEEENSYNSDINKEIDEFEEIEEDIISEEPINVDKIKDNFNLEDTMIVEDDFDKLLQIEMEAKKKAEEKVKLSQNNKYEIDQKKAFEEAKRKADEILNNNSDVVSELDESELEEI
ncbi:MAG: hypothetical protein CMF62_02695 [Magnetococcales bacterium]|nr:hypothetical protein [Magnetococcales bacterium]|tara:strand:+ start:50335 stop:50970 length:636 start_codon:yes stop_codon:yes gene_type:complete